MPFVEDSDKLVYWGLCQHPKEIKVKEMGEGGRYGKSDERWYENKGEDGFKSLHFMADCMWTCLWKCVFVWGGGEVPLTDKCWQGEGGG